MYDRFRSGVSSRGSGSLTGRASSPVGWGTLPNMRVYSLGAPVPQDG